MSDSESITESDPGSTSNEDDVSIEESMHSLDLNARTNGVRPTQISPSSSTLPTTSDDNTAHRINALQTALYKAHMQVQHSKSQNSALREENMSLSNQKKSKRRRQGLISASTPEETQADLGTDPPVASQKGHLSRASALGRQFAVRYYPWMPKAFTQRLGHSRPSIDIENIQERFADKESQAEARLAEAWLFLATDKDIRRRLGYDGEIASHFSEGVNSEKCKFVSAASQNLPVIFGDLKNSDGTPLASSALYKGSDALKAIGPANDDDIFCQVVMHPDHPAHGSYLFWSHRIIRVIWGGLFGLSAAAKGPKTSNTKANRWQYKEVTPGLIAFSAVVLIYLTSGDEQFVPPGTSIKVTWDYPFWFNRYLKMLLQSQHNPGIQQLFAWINREVFGHLKHGLSGADSEESSMVSAETRARNQEMMSMFGMAVDMGDAVPPASAPSPSPLPSSSAPLNPARICSLPPSSMITPPSVLPPASHPSSSFASQDTASLTAAATATFAEDTESTSTSRNPQASSVQPFHQEHMNDTTLTTTINPTGPAQTKLAKRGKGKSAVTKRPTRVSPRNRVATE